MTPERRPEAARRWLEDGPLDAALVVLVERLASDKRGSVNPPSPPKTPAFAGLTRPTGSRGRGRDHAVCRIGGRK